MGGLEHERAIAEARLRLFGVASDLRIGRYRIERRLGAGGMGEVYLAHDDQLDRKVAIKRVLTTFTSEREQVRLRSEARALAKLSHANVVLVYEIGEHEQRTFLAMEFVDGQTLSVWLAESPRPWPAVLDRFLAAGRGLAAAHQAGVVHRDFKPDNVLLGHDGSVRVADFGLAIAGEGEREGEREGEGERGASATRLTLGSVAGTIRYMAIEQLIGESVDAHSDQFSFCVALYEALWAEPPFALGSLEQRAHALATDEPKPPRGSRVPAGLWRVVRRGLARAPEHRWPDMPSLLEALERLPRRRRWAIAAGLTAPILAVVIGAQAVLAERERNATILACAAEGQAIDDDWNDEVRANLERAFVATGREFAPTTWQLTAARMDSFAREWAELRTQSCRATEVEHTQTEELRGQTAACLDDARASFRALADTWAQADDTMVLHATMAVAGLPVLATCTDKAWLASRVKARPDIAPAVARARARLERVRALKLAVQFDRGLAEARSVLADAELLGWAPLIVEARLAVGDMQDRVGHYVDARATLHRTFLEALGSGHDFIALRASISLTLVDAVRLGRPAQGLEWAALAEVLVERLELGGSMHEASAAYALGRAQRAKGDLRAALATHRRVLALDESVHGLDHPDIALSLQSIGFLLRSLGELDEAQTALEQALAIQQRLLGREHPDVAGSLIGLGKVADARGDHEGALELHRAALQIETTALGPDHIYVASTLDLVATALTRRGEHEQALELRTRAVAIRTATHGPDHPAVGWALVRQGEALLDRGQFEPATTCFERALAIFAAAEPSEPAGIAASLAGRGEAEFRLGRSADAEQTLARSLSLAGDAETHFVFAQVLWALDQPQRALEQARMARSARAVGGVRDRGLADLDAWLREHPC